MIALSRNRQLYLEADNSQSRVVFGTEHDLKGTVLLKMKNTFVESNIINKMCNKTLY
jgi:hypothetical protein